MMNVPSFSSSQSANLAPFRKTRPLTVVGAVTCDLDIAQEDVLALVQEGSLIGFDIAVTKGVKVCLRILTWSKVHFQFTNGKRLEMDWRSIFELIRPLPDRHIRANFIERSLNCDRTHVSNLMESGAFEVVSESKPGPGGSAVITTASFEAWLKGRML